ncbi:hypothetical protein LWI28_003744 [Acer negundo]|uniref:Uncharacterized protein n=1 Tax=Acer negundo TaxID=4023 RepID=A0AAD5I8E2_ACENE|nr:hypothetical protein LWI28_003744 [Acer negundo]
MSPLPNTCRVHALMLQQERQTDVVAHRESMGYVTMQTFRNSQESGQSQENDRSTTTGKVKKTCSHYCRDYHTTDRCYFLHGFPPGHKLYGKDIKPRGKRPNANNSTAKENFKVQSFTNTTFILEEYNQHKALLWKNNGNVLPFVNTTGHGYKEDDGLGK